MAFFKKQKSSPEQARRRAVVSNPTSRRAQAFSYYAQRSTPQANTGRGAQLENLTLEADAWPWYWRRAVVIPGVIVVLVVLGFVLNLDSTPKIVPLTTTGSAYFLQDQSVYQQTATQALQASVFNKNKLTFDSAAVSKAITSHYPEIQTATITVPLFGHRPVIYLTPYQPAFILTTSANAAFLLNQNGRALVSISQISDPQKLSVPTVEDKSGLEIKLGSQALPTGTVHFILQTGQMLNAAKVAYQDLMLPPASSELDVTIAGTPYFVKFNMQGDAKQQVGTFLATKERLDKDKVTPARYIDVRVSGRAYYQ